jgi:hypothetical protein
MYQFRCRNKQHILEFSMSDQYLVTRPFDLIIPLHPTSFFYFVLGVAPREKNRHGTAVPSWRGVN